MSGLPIPIALERLPAAPAGCGVCSARQACLPKGLDDEGVKRLEQIIQARRRVPRGAQLFRMTDSFRNVYAVRAGHFKTYRINPAGAQQVIGFHPSADLLGVDAIGSGQHDCGAEALEDSEVCEIPFLRLQELFASTPVLRRHFHRVMGQAIVRDQSAMFLLGNMPAEQRLALFVVNLSTFYAARGYSSTHVQLRMSREDIASYLGLSIESISRMLLRLKNKGWLEVDRRAIVIVDMAQLKALASGQSTA
ncbi:CRP/FNR family transcriptional regulator [Oxalobacteraceae bacterium GrIS 1.11]